MKAWIFFFFAAAFATESNDQARDIDNPRRRLVGLQDSYGMIFDCLVVLWVFAFWYLGFFTLNQHFLYENKWNMMLFFGSTALTQIMILMTRLMTQFIHKSEGGLGYYNIGANVVNGIFAGLFGLFVHQPLSHKKLPDQLYEIRNKIKLATVYFNLIVMSIVLVQLFLFARGFSEHVLYVLLFVGRPIMNLILESKNITNQSLRNCFFRKNKLIFYGMLLPVLFSTLGLLTYSRIAMILAAGEKWVCNELTGSDVTRNFVAELFNSNIAIIIMIVIVLNTIDIFVYPIL